MSLNFGKCMNENMNGEQADVIDITSLLQLPSP